jgi:hypothetical protein
MDDATSGRANGAAAETALPALARQLRDLRDALATFLEALDETLAGLTPAGEKGDRDGR